MGIAICHLNAAGFTTSMLWQYTLLWHTGTGSVYNSYQYRYDYGIILYTVYCSIVLYLQ